MKSKPDKKHKKRRQEQHKKNALAELPPVEQAQLLLDEATGLMQTGQPEQALSKVKKSLHCLDSPSIEAPLRLPSLERLAQVYIELGEVDSAQETFLEAAGIDPSGEIPDELGGGADKFLWLAQLCEEGGAESIRWFERGIGVLRRQVGELDGSADEDEDDETPALEDKKNKLANALCGAAEVYMTDLSWEDDAETRCEALVTEACFVAPQSPEPLQTLASVRISQTKFDDARAALHRSMELWSDLPPEDPKVPDFPTRISLARLLMEVQLEEKALDVLERLVTEDDSSVEAWYLGGWCLYLLSQKSSEQEKKLQIGSRDWLMNSLRLIGQLDYEDDRLREHAQELVRELIQTVGPPKDATAQDQEEDEDEWEDEEEDAEGEEEEDDDDDSMLNGEEEMKDV